ncbi:MAG: SAM-dependent methyltransferase, partial [Nannocystaceae bacterium]
WPGSWLQFVAPKIGPEGLGVGVDLKAVSIDLPDHIQTLEGDVFKLKPEAFTKKFGAFSVVISDMAPQTSGDRPGDQFGSEELFLRALEIARGCLRPGGHFAAKIFQGPRFPEILRAVKDSFQEAKAFRPASTRAGSFEQYLVGRGLKASAQATAPDGD